MIKINKIVCTVALMLTGLLTFCGCDTSKYEELGNDIAALSSDIQIVVENNYDEETANELKEAAEMLGDMDTSELVDALGSAIENSGLMEDGMANEDNQETVGEQQENESTDNRTPVRNATIVIDPGHQIKGNNDKEPIGPGATETKAKVTGGTSGRFSGLPEYQVNLSVALLLRDKLEAKGYNVIMVRETNEVDISNSERAKVANDNNADVFIRIHCNGSENNTANGAMTICPTSNNPYCSNIYSQSRKLSDCVLEAICSESGCRREKVWETDTMSGINWCQVPVTIVEMGYMTNQTEDMNLADPGYQDKMAEGMLKGIEKYLQ